jgi:hypothetical protein
MTISDTVMTISKAVMNQREQDIWVVSHLQGRVELGH